MKGLTEYYCINCKQKVKCEVIASIKEVQSQHRILVNLDLYCPSCGTILASGEGVIEIC